jgi:hypothetical protein
VVLPTGGVRRCGKLGNAKKLLPSQPVVTFGTALPTFRSVKTAGLKEDPDKNDENDIGSGGYMPNRESTSIVNCKLQRRTRRSSGS